VSEIVVAAEIFKPGPPAEIRSATIPQTFKRRLETHLLLPGLFIADCNTPACVLFCDGRRTLIYNYIITIIIIHIVIIIYIRVQTRITRPTRALPLHLPGIGDI
jgi:hypothetical protein